MCAVLIIPKPHMNPNLCKIKKKNLSSDVKSPDNVKNFIGILWKQKKLSNFAAQF